MQPFGRQHPDPPAPFAAFRSPSAVWPSARRLQRSFRLASDSNVTHNITCLKTCRGALCSLLVRSIRPVPFATFRSPSTVLWPSRAPSWKFSTGFRQQLPLNLPWRPLQPFGRQHPGPPVPFAAFRSASAVLWPSAGRLQRSVRLGLESDVRQSPAFKFGSAGSHVACPTSFPERLELSPQTADPPTPGPEKHQKSFTLLGESFLDGIRVAHKRLQEHPPSRFEGA